MSEQPLASSRVELEIDFDDLDEELKKGLAGKVKKAADDAEKALDKIPKAAARAGKKISTEVGGGAKDAARQVKAAAAQAQEYLDDLADAGDRAGDAIGDGIAAGASRAARALSRLADSGQGGLFDIDDKGRFVELAREVEAVQESLFDLGSVELDSGRVERLAADLDRVGAAGDRAALSLRERLSSAAVSAAASVRTAAQDAANAVDGVFGGRISRSAAAAGDLVDRLFAERNTSGLADDVEEIGEQVERLGKRAGKTGGQLDRFSGRLGILISAIAAATIIAPAFVQAGLAVGAFGALAVPTLKDVFDAAKDTADGFDALSAEQRIAFAGTKLFAREFRDTARALEPDVLRVYNGVLDNTASILPRLVPLGRAAGAALAEANTRIGESLNGDRADKFFADLETSAGPAIDSVVTLLLDLTAAVASTVTALAPLAGAGLGVVSMALNLITALNELSPALLQAVALFLALRSPLAGVTGLIGKFGSNAGDAAKGIGKASLGTRLLNAATSAGPALYLGAAVAVLTLAANLGVASDRYAVLVKNLAVNSRAVGNNVSGFQTLNNTLRQQLAASTLETAKTTAQLGISMEQAAQSTGVFNADLSDQAQAQQATREAIDATNLSLLNITTGADAIAAKFGGTRDQAIQLADAIGLNLNKGVLENGELTTAAATKLQNYQDKVRLANNPTLALAVGITQASNESLLWTERLAGLQSALETAFTPTLSLFSAQNNLKRAFQESNRVLEDKAATDLNRTTALESELGAVVKIAEAQLRANGTVEEASTIIANNADRYLELAGSSKTGQKAISDLQTVFGVLREKGKDSTLTVEDLKEAINGLKSKDVNVNVNTNGAIGPLNNLLGLIGKIPPTVGIGVLATGATGGLVGAGRLPSIVPGLAVGGPASGKVKGPGTTTSDSILARLSRDEFVINAKSTRKYQPLIQAINADKFARGGLVGRGALPGFASGGQVRGRGARLVPVRLDLDLSDKAEKALRERIKAIGQTLGSDLTKSLTGSPAEITRAAKALEKSIFSAFSKIRTKGDDVLIARIKKVNTNLVDLATERDLLVKRLDEGKAFATSTRDDARRFAGLAGFSDAESFTPGAVQRTLDRRLVQIERFTADVAALGRRGIGKGLIQQIVEEGPDGGARLAALLRTADDATIAAINKTQGRIDKATTRLGRNTADFLFDAGAQASKGFLAGLESDREAIVKLMRDIAESVSKSVRSTLKIKSPSRVLQMDGVDSADGYILGWEKRRGDIQKTVARAVRPEVKVQRAADLVPRVEGRQGGRAQAAAQATVPNVINQTNHLYNIVDPNAILSIVEGRLVAATR